MLTDGVTELEGPGWNYRRPFMATICGPFDITGAVRPAGKNQGRFWENNPVGEMPPNPQQVRNSISYVSLESERI